MDKLFFELIRVSIGRAEKLSHTPSAEEWEWLFNKAQEQTLGGVLLTALDRVPEDQRPPRKLVFNWHSLAEQIAAINRRLDHDTVWVSSRWKKLGYHNVILKGQGNARLYPNPSLRHAGDIDIWLDGDLHKIANYVLKHFPHLEVTRIEMDFPVKKETTIELHFTPSFLYNPFTNKRMQRYFKEQIHKTERTQLPEGEVDIPGMEMNLVFQLSHIYRHLFYEGIGLRQLMDYYYLLLQPSAKEHSESVKQILKSLNLTKFAAALMWVLGEVFHLPNEEMLITPDEKEGKFLLKEIMRAGNFGHADDRTGNWAEMNRWERLIWGTKWSFRLIRHYPNEVIWHPYYRINQYIWRLRHGYLGK